MLYRTGEREEFDLSPLPDVEWRLFYYMVYEYERARSWAAFEMRTAHGIIEAAKAALGKEWQSHPLYRIQKDLMGNVGVRQKELRGEISDMIVE